MLLSAALTWQVADPLPGLQRAARRDTTPQDRVTHDPSWLLCWDLVSERADRCDPSLRKPYFLERTDG